MNPKVRHEPETSKAGDLATLLRLRPRLVGAARKARAVDPELAADAALAKLAPLGLEGADLARKGAELAYNAASAQRRSEARRTKREADAVDGTPERATRKPRIAGHRVLPNGFVERSDPKPTRHVPVAVTPEIRAAATELLELFVVTERGGVRRGGLLQIVQAQERGSAEFVRIVRETFAVVFGFTPEDAEDVREGLAIVQSVKWALMACKATDPEKGDRPWSPELWSPFVKKGHGFTVPDWLTAEGFAELMARATLADRGGAGRVPVEKLVLKKINARRKTKGLRQLSNLGT